MAEGRALFKSLVAQITVAETAEAFVAALARKHEGAHTYALAA